ncbi:hypothetical protein PanWU01x14_153330 [Parasponia andersonii]|uniref:Uncharacterized protein n=1 Tax=Parasponia andersonii TaxID=3476 RepID=A0A2P5CH32_PARAD|nr:hypothetical protein PanWU01x14_153330 [Parasponia andersonii]
MLNIPRLSFHGTSGFFLLCLHKLGVSKVLENVSSEKIEFCVLPNNLPNRIEVMKAQLEDEMDTAQKAQFCVLQEKLGLLARLPYATKMRWIRLKEVVSVVVMNIRASSGLIHGKKAV